jgi:serine O-acetyltransferase
VEIGYGLWIPHASCIVFGDAIIGNDVKIYQGVTLGASWGHEKGGRRYPTIRDNVKISAGAKIIGPVVIGKNSIIGANAVVVDDIPEDSIAVGIPAKFVRRTQQ